MNSLKTFYVTTNLLGLNFHKLKVSIYIILIFQSLVQLVGLYSVFYFPFFQSIKVWYRGNGIYSVTQIYQSIFPFLIQNFMIIRALIMRNQQKFLSLKLRPKFTQKYGKCEKSFLKRISFIILIRIAKHFFIISYDSIVFYSQTTFAELIYSSNDLMFVYYVELLIEYLDFIKHKVEMIRTKNDFKIIKMELLEVFKLKRKILDRYSIDIFITIFYHFILMIISFYWVIMRLIFNHLKKFYQFATFLHFPEPIFVYYILFSSCESFYRKLKEIELNLYMKTLKFKKSESIFILLNSIESKFIICGMISMKIETLTDVSLTF